MKVTFKDLTMTYGKKEVLHNLNFTIPEGSLVSILGPSGCGKSTTLMLMSGLIFPSAGQIFFDEEDVTKKDALARKVGMVFQNYALYPHLTVLDNIAFPLKMEKVKKSERRAKALELAKLVHIEDQIDKKPGELSGGQQQRVAIARALAKKPSILLLDEPLSNLDARLRIEMRDEIRRIQKETGITTVFVTHDQDEALHISDKIMVLNGGSVQQFSSPNQLYDVPSNLFVAQFIGSPVINSLPAALFKEALKEIVAPDILEQSVTIGLRSESIVPTLEGEKVLFKSEGKINDFEQFGREATTVIGLNEHEMTSTSIEHEQTVQEKIEFGVLKRGFFLFDKEGKLIFGGDSYDG